MSVYREDPKYSAKPTLLQRLGRILLILILLMGLASGIFLLFFRGFVVDTPEGRELRLPFLAQEPQTTAFSSDSVTMPNSPTPELPDPLHAVLLPLSSCEEGTVGDDLRRHKANAAVFDMKDSSGSLSYVSTLSQAISSGASAADPERNQQLIHMNQLEGLYTVARVSCFRDDLLAQRNPELALTRVSGSPWRDEDRNAWLSPSQDQVQAYLLDVCRELAALGFDEILLTNCAYPVTGRQELLREDQNTIPDLRTSVLEGFYGELSNVLKEEGMVLSIQWEGSLDAESTAPLNGQGLSITALAADRIWVEAGEEALSAVFAGQGLSAETLSLVSVGTVPGESSNSWAILEEFS